MVKMAHFARDLIDAPAPDPASLHPRELARLLRLGSRFRDLGPDDQYRLAIESAGFWSLGNRLGEDFDLVSEGEIDNLNTSVGEANTLLLYADGENGYIFLNGEFIALMDLSQRLDAGEIAVATGLYEGDEIEGAETVFTGFTIWVQE